MKHRSESVSIPVVKYTTGTAPLITFSESRPPISVLLLLFFTMSGIVPVMFGDPGEKIF